MFSRISNWWYGTKPAAPALKPALSDDTPSTEPSLLQDGISEFTERLDAEKAILTRLMNEWIQHKKDVMGHDMPHPDHPHEVQCAKETEEKVKSLVKLFFHRIKCYFQSAQSYLHDEIQREVVGHMQPLRQHINALCEQANDISRSEDERRGIVIHICNASIVLLNELNGLVEDVDTELKYCLKAEQQAEKAAKFGINAGLLLLSGIIGMMIPPVNFNLNENYRHFLSNEIQGEKAELICDITEEEGTLQLAGGIVENYAEKLRRSGGFFPQPSVADSLTAPSPTPVVSPTLR
jgi:hypothetical protein